MNELAVLSSVPTGLFIGGKWRAAAADRRFAVEDPATQKVLAEVADAAPTDAVAALDAAAAAQPDWAATPARERAELLRAAFERITARADDLALLMTLEMGKPLAQSRAEVSYGAEFFRWFSEEAVRVAGRWATAPDGQTRLVTSKQPVGPTLMITPWNFPLAMGARKIGPAIAAGCTMVVKPAPQTPLTTLALAQILHEVGVPAGVVNVLTTTRAAELTAPLMSNPRLRKLTFTGSTGVGKHLVRQSADNLLRVSLELGGNAPFLVFADADLDQAVEGAMLAKMRNMGEACTAANRFLVHEAVAADFAERFAAQMRQQVLGRGTDEGVTVGPLIDAHAQDKVASLVADAKGRGATVLCGGAVTGDIGYFFEPTVLTDVPADAILLDEEIFGPVAPISTFATEQEAVAAANNTPYGLASYLFTQDLSRALTVSEALQYGMVGVNQGIVSNPAAPFGGIKQSGLGREGGPEGINEYLDVKYVGLAVHPPVLRSSSDRSRT